MFTTAQVDVKAGLSEDFSGRNEDAQWWLLTMSTYFKMCGTKYSVTQQKLILFNKMSKGWGANFFEGWLSKIPNDEVPETQKTMEQIIENFEKNFLPTDKTSRAWATLADFWVKGVPFYGDFHGFCYAFELEAGKSRIKDHNVQKDVLKQAYWPSFQDDACGKWA